MRTFFTALLMIFSTTIGCAGESLPEEELILSTPEQIGTQNFQIKDLISPLNGNLALRQIDLIARGAQDVVLERIYVSTNIPSTFHDKRENKQDWDKYFLFEHLWKNYKGWQFFPHVRLQVYPDQRG